MFEEPDADIQKKFDGIKEDYTQKKRLNESYYRMQDNVYDFDYFAANADFW